MYQQELADHKLMSRHGFDHKAVGPVLFMIYILDHTTNDVTPMFI